MSVVALVLILGPPLLVDMRGLDPPQRVEAITATRTVLVQVVAGLVLVVGLVFTALNVYISREGQITDRYTKAVDQLADERLSVRLGGIYALERIARDSRRDHPQIVETLSAFIREQSHTAKRKTSATLTVDSRYGYTTNPTKVMSELPVDIQAALRVLLRRKPGRPEFGPLDLRGADLRSADLSEANLREALLIGTLLQSAMLYRADLSHADLRGAQLEDADLTYARLDHTDFTGSNLSKARLVAVVGEWTRFNGAQLQEADLYNAVLPDAWLIDNAQLKGAKLVLAYLESACLFDSSAENADFRGACLHEARLQNTNLRSAQFQTHPPSSNVHIPAADLSGAILAGAILDGADFYGTRLRGTGLQDIDLSKVRRLTRAQLRSAHLGQTLVPSNVSDDGPPPCEHCDKPIDWRARATRIRREALGLPPPRWSRERWRRELS